MLSIRYEKDLSKLYQGTVATGTITTAQKTSGYYYGVSLLKNEPIYLPAWSGICPFKTENEQTNLPGTWIYLQNESGELLTLKVGNIQISFTKAK
jgi:hypothetical protein